MTNRRLAEYLAINAMTTGALFGIVAEQANYGHLWSWATPFPVVACIWFYRRMTKAIDQLESQSETR